LAFQGIDKKEDVGIHYFGRSPEVVMAKRTERRPLTSKETAMCNTHLHDPPAGTKRNFDVNMETSIFGTIGAGATYAGGTNCQLQ